MSFVSFIVENAADANRLAVCTDLVAGREKWECCRPAAAMVFDCCAGRQTRWKLDLTAYLHLIMV